MDLYPGTEENLARMARWIGNLGDSLTLWAAGSGTEEEQAMRDLLARMIPDSAHVFWKKGFWVPDEEKGFESEEGAVYAQGSGPLVLINFSRTPAHLADLLQKAYALEDSVVLLLVHEWPSNVKKHFAQMAELSVAFRLFMWTTSERKSAILFGPIGSASPLNPTSLHFTPGIAFGSYTKCGRTISALRSTF